MTAPVGTPRGLTAAFALAGVVVAGAIAGFETSHPIHEAKFDLGRKRPVIKPVAPPEGPADSVPSPPPNGPILAQNAGSPPPEGGDATKFTTPSGIEVDLQGHTVTLQGRVSIQAGLIEVFACTEGGKDHESIVVVAYPPQELQLALILLGLKEGTEGPRGLGDPTKPTGDRAVCEIEWTRDGKVERHWAEDCVRNGRERAAMPRVGWVYTGSEFHNEIDPDTGKPTGRTVYAANRQKTLIATLHDPTALLDNPLYDGGDDGVYFAEERVLPTPGTPVRILIRPATAEETKAMLELETACDEKSPVRPGAIPPEPPKEK
ncbi:MAG: hypothetical protein HYY93_01335 [Planctomycetes bacterium]|nr:hypothetical protein [Planctomycetota bacterium]